MGGTGAIAFATSRRLLASGWQVELTGRDRAQLPAELIYSGATLTALDRDTSN